MNPTKELIILKFGGSIITDDSKFETFNEEITKNLALEVASLSKKYSFIIVHGAGSFGHYHAKEYDLKNGLKDEKQLSGIIKTHNSMMKLNTLFLNTFKNIDSFYPISFSPFTICKTKNGIISKFDLLNIENALNLGLTPIIFGDVVLDESLGVTILSGDKIVPYLALHLKPKKILMLTDVEGVYDDNPKKNAQAKLIDEINLKDSELMQKISKNAESGKTRVTGEMEKKLLELQQVVENNIETWILSGLIKGNLTKKLQTENKIGTKITSH
jgi:isopentenyl phosphate kinase